MRYLAGFVGVILGVAVHAATPDRDKLIGSWEAKSSGDSAAVWTLAAHGDSIRITQMQNDQKLAEMECNTVGRECEVKQSGKPIKVSMWFNGPKLVVMEVKGSEVLKRRFHATEDGSTMELEVIPIAPEGKPEVVHLIRAAASR